MKHEITNAEVKGLIMAIKEIYDNNMELPFKLHYALGKNKRMLKVLDEAIDAKALEKMKKYGTKGKYDVVKLDAAQQKAFQKDYNDLLMLENDPLEFHKVTYELMETELPRIKGVSNFDLIIHFIINEPAVPSKILKPEQNTIPL